MEAITAAICAALAAGLNETGKTAAKDAYNALKNKITSLLGQDSEQVKALQKLEERPDSEVRRLVLKEELADSNIAQNAEIQNLVAALSKALQDSAEGKTALAQFNIQAETIGTVANTVGTIKQKF